MSIKHYSIEPNLEIHILHFSNPSVSSILCHFLFRNLYLLYHRPLFHNIVKDQDFLNLIKFDLYLFTRFFELFLSIMLN
jgi:hypothetical protein